MKMKKLLTVVAAMFVLGSSAFAFDGSTFWRQYGGGLKDGDGVFSIGTGVGADLAIVLPIFSTYGVNVFYLPYIETSYEKMVHINDTIPLSFGGYGGFNMYSYHYDEHNYFYSNAHVGALAKYHFNFWDNNMDVYAGLKLGLNASINFNDGAFVTTGSLLNLDHGEIIGIQWFWGGFGITLETGYPYWLNFKLSFKM